MATKWLSSVNGSDSNDGSTKALAKSTWAGAIGVMSAGDTLNVDSANSEPYAAHKTLSFPGTIASPCIIISINWTTEAYEQATTSQLYTTGSYHLYLNSTSMMYVYGIHMTIGVRFYPNNTANNSIKYHDCIFDWPAGQSYPSVYALGGSSNTLFKKCTFPLPCTSVAGTVWFGATSMYRINISFIGCTFTITDATLPAGFTIFNLDNIGNNANSLNLRGCDFSGVAADYLIKHDESATSQNINTVYIENARLHADTTVFSNTPIKTFQPDLVHAQNVDSANTVSRIDLHEHEGEVTVDTSIYRTGGYAPASSAQSWLMESNANAVEFRAPLRIKLADLVADTSSAATFTVHIVFDSATDLQDDEIWIEVEYPDDTTAAFHFEDDRAADILATPANQASSSESWTGTGGFSNENKQQCAVTTTNTGKEGPTTVYICLAKPSTDVYVCPKVEVS